MRRGARRPSWSAGATLLLVGLLSSCGGRTAEPARREPSGVEEGAPREPPPTPRRVGGEGPADEGASEPARAPRRVEVEDEPGSRARRERVPPPPIEPPGH